MNEELKLKKEQNALIAELCASVRESKEINAEIAENLEKDVDRAVEQMNNLSQSQREFEKTIVSDVNHEIRCSCLQIKDEAKEAVSKAVDEGKWKVQQLYKDYDDKTRDTLERIGWIEEKLRIHSGLQKFFFWVTPVLMLIQTIALVFALLH